jgi:pyruvate dehydrogenase E1 component alpha subunit
MSDPQKYRTKDEVEAFKAKDSIAALLSHLMGERRAIDEAGWEAMQGQIRERCLAAVEYAEKAAVPDVAAELTSDVYALPMKNLSPQVEYRHGARNALL